LAQLERRLEGLVRDHGIDVIHYHYAWPFAGIVRRLKRRLGAAAPQFVCTFHGTDVTQPPGDACGAALAGGRSSIGLADRVPGSPSFFAETRRPGPRLSLPRARTPVRRTRTHPKASRMPTCGPVGNPLISRGLGEEVLSGREGGEGSGRHAGLSPERPDVVEATEATGLRVVSSRMYSSHVP